MIAGNLYSVYFYTSIIIFLPIVVISGLGNEINVSKIHVPTNIIRNFTKEKGGNEVNLQLSMEDVGKRPYTLAETLHRTYSEFEELFENILSIVTEYVPRISRDAETFLAKLSNYTTNALLAFSNKLLNEGDDFISEMFRNFERQVESVSLEFESLAASVDEHFNWAVTQLNLTLMNNTEEYDWWTAHIKQKLRTFNDTKLYQKGCRAVDAFIISSTKELHNCCKITMKPMRSLCKSANSLITQALHTIVDSVDRMQSCIEEKSSYMDFMLPCIGLAYDEIITLVSRAALITRQINNMLPMKVIYTRSCFAIVKVDMNVRRNEIEADLFSP